MRKIDSKQELLLTIRNKLKRAGHPVKALQMQSYMKSTMPFHGVAAVDVRKICKSLFENLELTQESWQETVMYLWQNAKFREERYAAMHLCADKKAQKFQTPSVLPIYEQMIVTGAWWDYVDDLSQKIGNILRKYPSPTKNKMLSWSKSRNLWKRRAAIICQLLLKENTDLNLLFACIEPSLNSNEFFLQKAIGWALRQYARIDADTVLKYIDDKGVRLAPLSRREALKHIKPLRNRQ